MSVEIKGRHHASGGVSHLALSTRHLAYQAYGTEMISERHRHRYEVNNELRDGIVQPWTGTGRHPPNGKLVEMVEFASRDVHPWFMGVQFHRN